MLHRLGCHQHVHLLHPAQLRHGSSCKASEAPSCCHSAPLEVVAQHPRSRRNSLELASSITRTGGSALFTQAGPSSIKERLRQRRFSIAIGESLHKLRPIREGETEDAAGSGDQSPLSTKGSHSSRSHHSLGLRVWSPPPVDALPGALCAARTPSDPGVAGGLDPAGMFALLQHSGAHTAAQQQQGDGQLHPPQVLQMHHSNSHTLTGLSQEEIWHHLQQRRLEQQRQREQQQQQQSRRARRATAPPTLQQHHHRRVAQHQHQQAVDDSFGFGAQPQQHQQSEDDLESLQQQLQELSYTRPGSLPTPVLHNITSSSRVSSVPMQHQAQVVVDQVVRPQLAQQHVEALAALHEIEGELQQLLSMQDRLAAARSVAPPGSRAAAACEAALARHRAVLQQALAARQEIASAVFEATAAMQALAARSCMSTSLQWEAAAELMRLHDADAAQCESLGWLEGFDEEPLYPADAESLLQHFGHYAII